MTGTDLAAAERSAGHAPRRPVPPGDRWSRLRSQPRRRHGLAPPGGGGRPGLGTALKSAELPAVPVGEVDQMWSARASIGKGERTSA
jgi:hypothetical protein